MIRLETSKCTGIANHQGDKLSHVHLNWARSISREYPSAIQRTKESPVYNCHGLTFANHRTRIETRVALNTILADDMYREVPRNSVLPGDVVIYYSEDGDPNHSQGNTRTRSVFQIGGIPVLEPGILKFSVTMENGTEAVYDLPIVPRVRSASVEPSPEQKSLKFG